MNSTVIPAGVRGDSVHGMVHGGQQPISGATIQLYAVGTTGDGSAATPLLTSPVTTDANGNFSLANDFTCPTASTQVYLTGTGGNPGISGFGSNTAIAMMAALGSCGSLGPSTYIVMNEVTTVGSLAALYPFMTDYGHLGSGSGDATALTQAFATVNEYVSIANGTAPGPALPTGYYASSTENDTLSNVVSTCVNSQGGTAGDGSVCGTLFTVATPAAYPTPTDIITAVLNILRSPTTNVSALYNLTPAIGAPFQPSLTAAPTTFALPIVPRAAAVTITGLDSSYHSAAAVYVTMTTTTPGASIYYNAGSELTPTAGSTLYTGPFFLNGSQTYTAIAAATGYLNSAATSASFTSNYGSQNYNDSVPVFSPLGGIYSSPQTVTMTAATGAKIYYTTDGSAAITLNATQVNPAATLYTGPLLVSASEQINAVSVVNGVISPQAYVPYTIGSHYNGTLSVYAGTGATGHTGDGGAATSATLNVPANPVVDSTGNLYFVDSGNMCIRKITPAGIISTVVTDSYLSSANAPLAIDGSGNLYYLGGGNPYRSSIHTLTPSGTNTYSTLPTGIGSVAGIAVDSKGNMYLADPTKYVVWKIDTSGVLTTFAGTGVQGIPPGYTAGPFYTLSGLAIDGQDNLYVLDASLSSSERVVMIPPSSTPLTPILGSASPGGTYTIPGNGVSAQYAQIVALSGIAVDAAGDVYLNGSGYNEIFKIDTTGTLHIVAGFKTYPPGYSSGTALPANGAMMGSGTGIAVDASGSLYFPESTYMRIRKVSY